MTDNLEVTLVYATVTGTRLYECELYSFDVVGRPISIVSRRMGVHLAQILVILIVSAPTFTRD